MKTISVISVIFKKLKGARIANALYLPYTLAPCKLFYMLGLNGGKG